MALIGPGILFVFGLAFLWAWIIEKKRHYLLLLASAPILFGLGVIVQVFALPAESRAERFAVRPLFYTLAVLLAAEAIVRRSGKRFGLPLDLTFLAAIMGGLWYFVYIAPNLLVRVYIQNFGYGLIFLVAALYLKGSDTRPACRSCALLGAACLRCSLFHPHHSDDRIKRAGRSESVWCIAVLECTAFVSGGAGSGSRFSCLSRRRCPT